MFAAYVACLMVLAPLALLLGAPSLQKSATAVFYNWRLNQALVLILQDYTPWYAVDVVDASCLLLLTYWIIREIGGVRSLMMALLWLTYCAQIFMHFGFDAAQNSQWAYGYWHLLTVFAFAQLGIIAIWIIWDWLKGRRGKPCA